MAPGLALRSIECVAAWWEERSWRGASGFVWVQGWEVDRTGACSVMFWGVVEIMEVDRGL